MEFQIAPDLYQRAVTQPINGMDVSGTMRTLRNVAAATLFPLSLFAFNMAFFTLQTLPVMLTGGFIGAVLVLAAWWRRHMKLVGIHKTYNDAGGVQRFHIDAEKIDVSRPHIRSSVDWPFVTGIRGIDGASLIELPTARLIVPDVALPEGTTPDAFRADLKTWWQP